MLLSFHFSVPLKKRRKKEKGQYIRLHVVINLLILKDWSGVRMGLQLQVNILKLVFTIHSLQGVHTKYRKVIGAYPQGPPPLYL